MPAPGTRCVPFPTSQFEVADLYSDSPSRPPFDKMICVSCRPTSARVVWNLVHLKKAVTPVCAVGKGHGYQRRVIRSQPCSVFVHTPLNEKHSSEALTQSMQQDPAYAYQSTSPRANLGSPPRQLPLSSARSYHPSMPAQDTTELRREVVYDLRTFEEALVR